MTTCWLFRDQSYSPPFPCKEVEILLLLLKTQRGAVMTLLPVNSVISTYPWRTQHAGAGAGAAHGQAPSSGVRQDKTP